VAASTAVGLSSSQPSSIFYADSACTSVVTGRTLAAGDTETTFYFKDTTAGSPTLTAASGGLTSATQAQTITTAGGAARLGFVSPPQTVVAGACSTGAVVQSQDSFGNAV